MTTDIDLSRKPYFDDYDQEKDFYRVLYRPGVAVQTRELNQMQTGLQDQLDKFGRSIYKEGSVIEGCAFSFDNNYRYIKVEDTFANGGAISALGDFEQNYLINSNGLRALIIDSITGYEAQDPNLNTLYLKYLNSGTYPNGVVQSAFNGAEQLRVYTSANVTIGNINITTVTNSVGTAYGMSVTEGVIFKKGFFLRVNPQTVVVDRYNNVPDDISVGFSADETLITPEMDTSLLDNAAGSPNEDAPGAHRLKIIPNLITRITSQTGNTSNFFSLVDFKNGLPITIKNDPQYVSLNKELARRTYETNGDYVVNPFILSVSNKSTTDAKYSTHLNLVSSPGIGYVKGYRVEFINNNTADIRKGTDYASLADQSTSLNFGYYVNINEYSGDLGNQTISEIELHSVAKKSLTNRSFLSTGIASTTKIGSAYCRGVSYSSGSAGSPDAVYRLYLFNIVMLPGKNFSQVRSIYNSNGLKAFADVVLELDSVGNSIARIQDATNEPMMHVFGQNSIRPEGFGSTSNFVYRKRANSSFNGAGTMSVTLPTIGGSATEQMYYTGSYPSDAESKTIIVPLSDAFSTNNSGTITTYTGNGYILGSGTTFLDEYNVGDYIAANTSTTIEKRRITSIVSNLQLNVDSPFITANSGKNHQKFFPGGAPLNFGGSVTRTISANTSTITLQLGTGDTPNNSSSFQCSVYYDVFRSSTYPVAKVINRNTFVKIDTSNNVGGLKGSWSLGVPDVFKVNAVYVGNSYSTSNPDLKTQFTLDNGQRDSYYGLAQLTSSSNLPTGSKILVSLDNFTYNRSQGRGFFTAASYPIDDANTANTAAIQTTQIPVYVSVATANTIDLRDVVDIRPYAANTANAVATSSTATINPSSTLSLVVDSTHGGYIPTPDTQFQADIQYYLPRKDRVALTTAGDILVSEGAASVSPIEPNEIPGTMTIGIADIPAYPSLTPGDARISNRYDHSVKTTIKQTERYTMADISQFSKRISRLEYYTALNLLEQATSSLLVRSDVTGKNRFQNGILVDPFQDHTIGNTNNPEYSIAVDSTKGEARPQFRQMQIPMSFDEAASTNVQRTGEIISLPYTSTSVLSQDYASKLRNCIEGNIFNYTGRLVLDPPGVVDADITKQPDVNSNIDLNQNWVNLQNAWGTQWVNWVDTATPSTSTTTLISTNSDTYKEQVVTLTTQKQKELKFNVSNEINTEVGGTVTNVSLQPKVKETQVTCTMVGMKPNTRLYCYINNINMSAFVAPLNLTTNTFESYGSALVTSASGIAQCSVTIPSTSSFYFTAGTLEFKFLDISDLTQGESAITTSAVKDFIATSLSLKQNTLSIRNSTIDKAAQQIERNIQQITSLVPGQTISFSSANIADPQPVSEGGEGGAGGGDASGGGTGGGGVGGGGIAGGLEG